MKPAIGKTYMFLPTAKDVWNVIQETYSDAENASQIFEIKTDSGNEARRSGSHGILHRDARVFEFLARLNRELDDIRSRVLSRRRCSPSERSSLRCGKRKAEGE
ncbi:hypothetical protein CK203_021998 [Vitis vinifera]|uniref:Uncharacterized protein n=1 Tax=Vitis vinifera TaxID=29760 RepID=A0A438JFV0_VITVI|nr:hypothetical protein CK203_021998 [Vitis vinifera]